MGRPGNEANYMLLQVINNWMVNNRQPSQSALVVNVHSAATQLPLSSHSAVIQLSFSRYLLCLHDHFHLKQTIYARQVVGSGVLGLASWFGFTCGHVPLVHSHPHTLTRGLCGNEVLVSLSCTALLREEEIERGVAATQGGAESH